MARHQHEAEALISGHYWHDQQRQGPHASVHDTAFQDALLTQLAQATGTSIPGR